MVFVPTLSIASHVTLFETSASSFLISICHWMHMCPQFFGRCIIRLSPVVFEPWYRDPALRFVGFPLSGGEFSTFLGRMETFWETVLGSVESTSVPDRSTYALCAQAEASKSWMPTPHEPKLQPLRLSRPASSTRDPQKRFQRVRPLLGRRSPTSKTLIPRIYPYEPPVYYKPYSLGPARKSPQLSSLHKTVRLMTD